MNAFRLSTASRPAKLLLTCFLLVVSVGYLMGLVNVYDKTHLTYRGVVKNYRGSEEEMMYPKEFGDMVSITHTHISGWAMMFLLVLTVFLFSGFSTALKGTLGILPFVFIILDAGSMWLTRYVAPAFASLFMFCGVVLAALFFLVVILNLYDLWLRKAS